MRKIALTLMLIMIVSPLFAQEERGFTADRPGATEGVDVLPKGRVQWESGFSFELDKWDDCNEKVWTLNTSLLRWGFSDYAELCVRAQYLYVNIDGNCSTGLNDVGFGTKVRLLEGKGLVPSMGLLANVLVPGGSNTFLPKNWGGDIALAIANKPISVLSLGVSGKLIWLDAARPIFETSFGVTYNVTDRFLLMLDEYNRNYSTGAEYCLELSAGWQVASRLQLDLGVDILLNAPAKRQNIFVGFAWQITKK